MNNEPIAWYKENSNDYLIENIGQPSFQVQEFIDAGYIPLYTHTVELTDEEIHQAIRRGFSREGFLSDGIFLEIKELLRKAQEK